MANPFNVLNETTASARLGGAVGSGISQGLQILAEQKLGQIQKRSQQQEAYKMGKEAGLTDRDALLFSSYAPGSKESTSFLSNLWQRGGEQPQQGGSGMQALNGIPAGSPAVDQLQKVLSSLGQQQQGQQFQPFGQVPQFNQQFSQPQQAPVTPPNIPQVPKIPLSAQPQQPAGSSFYQPPLRERREERKIELKEESNREKAQTKKQQAIDESNKPFIANLTKAVPVAEEMHDKAQEMLELLDSGKVTSGLGGVAGRLTGGLSLNPESQRFLALSNDIAALLAANSGVATNFKIKFAQERKPNLQQKPATQRGLTLDLLKQADKVLSREKIANDIIGQNNFQQPPNLKSRVDEEYRKFKPESKKETGKNLFNDLPNPAELSGKRIRDTNTGDILQSDGTEWRKVS